MHSDNDIFYVENIPCVTARTLAQKLGYCHGTSVLNLGAQARHHFGVDPIPKTHDGRLRIDLPIPVYGALQLLRHSRSEKREEVQKWLEAVQRGENGKNGNE